MRTSELIAALAADPGSRADPARPAGRGRARDRVRRQSGDLCAPAGAEAGYRRGRQDGALQSQVRRLVRVRPAVAAADAAARPPRRQAEGARALADRALHFACRRAWSWNCWSCRKASGSSRLVGHNAMHLHVGRFRCWPRPFWRRSSSRCAPARLCTRRLTGALAGAASAGVAALLYASHCPDDSPLFVATWYPLATLICMGVGALAGRRFLAW